jgi:hypothetical protein
MTEVTYYADVATLEARAAEWRVAEVREMASVCTADVGGLTLGVATGPFACVEEQMRRKVKVTRAMLERVAVCQDVQTEHVLNRQSLGVGRVNHIWRVHGDELARRGDTLDAFDSATQEAMNRLFPGLTAESHEQATLSAAVGGLGWRRASDTARVANLGALVSVGPRVRSMAAATAHAGLVPTGQLERRLEEKTRRATEAYLSDLDEVERVKAEDFMRRASEAAEAQWLALIAGAEGSAVQAPMADASYAGPDELAPTGAGSVHDGGDAELDGRGPNISGPHVQKELAKLQDCTRLRRLEATLRQQSNWVQLDRLRELRHPEVSHSWLWHLDSSSGSVLAQVDYIANVQKRLGARCHDGVGPCRLCGAPLDPQLEHSETCATAEATRGHYACVRAVVAGLRLADASITTEPQGLTDTQTRPADILTTAAVPGRSAALDVCVASPNAAIAVRDAAEAAFLRKLRRYRREIPQLRAAGIIYRPLVWTADGRPHPAATRTLKFAAEQAANRSSENANAASLMRRWRHEIQVAIMRRRAAMGRAVLSRPSARALWLLTGQTDAGPNGGGREQPLHEDGPDSDLDDEVVEDDGTESLDEGAT